MEKRGAAAAVGSGAGNDAGAPLVVRSCDA